MNVTPLRLAAAAALATVLSALTLIPLLEGTSWLVAVVLVVGVLTLTGVAARALIPWWPAVVGLQVAAVTAAISTLFVRDVAVFGLVPGPASWEILGNLLATGLTATREESPPVPSSRGLILLVTAGLAVVGLLVDAVAVSLRKPAVAGLPLLAVYCVPAAVLPGGLSWLWFVLAALGFLVLVGSDVGDRVQAWGRVLGPAGADDRPGFGGPLAGGRRLAAGCLLGAVAVPALIPGLGENLLADQDDGLGQARGGNITVINPILRIRENLTQRDDVVVIRYRTSTQRPEPLRIVSNDAFDGDQWSPRVGPISRRNQVQDGLPAAPGLSDALRTSRLRTEITTLDLRQTYLPLPYPTTKVDIDGPWLFDPRTLNVVGDGVTTRNLQYSADHLAVAPAVDRLQAAPRAPSDILDTYARLPAGTPKEIAQTARRVAGEGTTYEQAIAIQQWLRNDGGFSYDETVLPPQGRDASSQDAVLAFLRNKQGYCVQFASTMAVMARTLGIPSRVGVGFLPGKQLPDGRWEISIRDAHAWPELYFPTIGWVRFEPTPAARTGQLPEWALPASEVEPGLEPTPSVSARPESPETVPTEEAQAGESPVEEEPSWLRRLLDAVPWRTVGVMLLLSSAAAVPLAVTIAARWLRRRRAASGPPAGRVEAAWDELRERLEDLGIAWAVSWTPRALQLRLVNDHALGGGEHAALGRLVADVEQVRYASPGSPVRDLAELQDDVERVVRGVTASAAVSRWTRHRSRWLPISGCRALVRGLRRADIAAEVAGRQWGDAVSESVRRLVGRR